MHIRNGQRADIAPAHPCSRVADRKTDTARRMISLALTPDRTECARRSLAIPTGILTVRAFLDPIESL